MALPTPYPPTQIAYTDWDTVIAAIEARLGTGAVGDLLMADTMSITTGIVNSDYFTIEVVDNDTNALVEIAKVLGASDPYISFGSSQEFKFYASGTSTLPTITGVTTFTAAGALDIGSFGFRAATLTADGLTATRVPFASTNGLLTDDSDMTFVTDTLTVTKIGATSFVGAVDFTNQSVTNVGAAGNDFGASNSLVATAFSGNVTISSGGTLLGGTDAITATDSGVAASVTTVITNVTTNADGDLDNVTLANGTAGQVKIIHCIAGTFPDTWKITPATMAGNTQITFNGAIGTGAVLVYNATSGWVVVGNEGGVIS